MKRRKLKRRCQPNLKLRHPMVMCKKMSQHNKLTMLLSIKKHLLKR